MEWANEASEENPQTIKGNSDITLLIALIAFVVFIAVAAFMIIVYTKGLYYPGWEPGTIHPFVAVIR